VPEGDTIWRVAAALRARILGQVVERSSHTGLEARRIEAIDAVGKHLIIRFEGGWAVRTHLGMHGSWWVFRPGERWSLPAWQARLVLETPDWVAVCFTAPTVEVTRDPEQALRGLGPDLLAPDVDLDLVVRRARMVGGETPLGVLLLDQRVAAGIGNVYRCEILWAKRRSPWQAAEELDDAQLRDLYSYAVEALRLNVRSEGYRRRFPDHLRPAVHSRGGRPCPRCGSLVQVRRQGVLARFTWFCPTCQPDPPTYSPFRT